MQRRTFLTTLTAGLFVPKFGRFFTPGVGVREQFGKVVLLGNYYDDWDTEHAVLQWSKPPMPGTSSHVATTVDPQYAQYLREYHYSFRAKVDAPFCVDSIGLWVNGEMFKIRPRGSPYISPDIAGTDVHINVSVPINGRNTMEVPA